MKFIVLFSFFFSFLAQSNDCNHLLLGWKSDPDIVKPVNGYIVSNASLGLKLEEFSHIKTLEADKIILTEDFFLNHDIEIPIDAVKVDLLTYGYYRKNAKTQRSSRGSGRSHLLADTKNFSDNIEFKGSGTNSYFSHVNSAFIDIDNFRNNGLAKLDETLQETIVGSILEKVGVPVSSHFEIKLLPDFIQNKLSIARNNYSEAAVQLTRLTEQGRESLYLGISESSYKEKMKTLGRMYSINAFHGALNPENVSLGGQLTDLGHTGVGYPLYSGGYRCNHCVGRDGSSADGTLVGLFDYFYPPEVNLDLVKTFVQDNNFRMYFERLNWLSGSDLDQHFKAAHPNFQKLLPKEQINNKSIEYLSGYLNEFYKILNSDSRNFTDDKVKEFATNYFQTKGRSYNFSVPAYHWNEFHKQLTWFLAHERSVSLSFKEINAIIETIEEKLFFKKDWYEVRKVSDNIFPVKLTSAFGDYTQPHRVSLSLRSLMQFVALKHYLGPEEYLQLIEKLRSEIVSEYQVSLETMISLFERTFENAAKNDLGFLFKEYIPSDLMIHKIRQRLKDIKSNEKAAIEVKSLFEELSEGIYVDPRVYFEEFMYL